MTHVYMIRPVTMKACPPLGHGPLCGQFRGSFALHGAHAQAGQAAGIHRAIDDAEYAWEPGCPPFVCCRNVLPRIAFNGSDRWNMRRQPSGMNQGSSRTSEIL